MLFTKLFTITTATSGALYRTLSELIFYIPYCARERRSRTLSPTFWWRCSGSPVEGAENVLWWNTVSIAQNFERNCGSMIRTYKRERQKNQMAHLCTKWRVLSRRWSRSEGPCCVYTLCLKNRTLRLIWHNFTNSQHSLIIFGTERPYSILNS